MKPLEFQYKKPPEVYAREQSYTHRLEMKADGQYLGFVDFEYRNDPFPFYYISLVFIKQKQRGKGFGAEIIQQMNAFLDSKRLPGILRNRIDEEHPAHGMYENHGWTPIAGTEGWMSYRLPADLEEGRLEKALYEIVEGAMRTEAAEEAKEKKAA